MTGSATAFFPYLHDTGAQFRLRVALAASVVFHLLFAQALIPDAPHRSTSVEGFSPITVRIERLPVLTQDVPATIAEAEAPSRPTQARQRIDTADERRAPPGMTPVATPLSLPQIPDPTVYTARDLDSYPRLIVPLDTGRIEPVAAGSPVVARFEVTIDERGGVSDVAIVGTAARLEKELSAMLATTRFIPARKDGRAVKSRVLLSISLAAGEGGR